MFSKKGFTIIEILVALSIFSIVSLAITWVLIYSFRSNTRLTDHLEIQASGRRSIQHMVDDIRRAEESSVGSFPIVTATTNTFTFYANIDSDTPRERIRFFLEGNMLKKGVIEPTGNPFTYDANAEVIISLSSFIQNNADGSALFTYYDETYTGSGDPLPSPVDVTLVRLIKIKLSLSKTQGTLVTPLILEGSAHIRNSKEN